MTLNDENYPKHIMKQSHIFFKNTDMSHHHRHQYKCLIVRIFKKIFTLYWSIVDLQCCAGFRCDLEIQKDLSKVIKVEIDMVMILILFI